jgi:hypothetical protein
MQPTEKGFLVALPLLAIVAVVAFQLGSANHAKTQTTAPTIAGQSSTPSLDDGEGNGERGSPPAPEAPPSAPAVLWLDANGDKYPVCPYCRSEVRMHSIACPRCTRSFRWEDISCPQCGGDGRVSCQVCKGTGKTSTKKCDNCKSEGVVAVQQNGKLWDPFDNNPPQYGQRRGKLQSMNEVWRIKYYECPDCKGTGHFPESCQNCRGLGYLRCGRCDGTGRYGA